jgi:hypothetical protein
MKHAVMASASLESLEQFLSQLQGDLKSLEGTLKLDVPKELHKVQITERTWGENASK